MSRIDSAMGMEHAEEEGSSKHKTLVYRKIPDISPARSEGMGSAVQIVDYTKVESETHYKGPIELTSKDGVDGSMNVSMVYSLDLDVTVRCKNYAPVQREFILNYRRGNKDCITEMLQREMHLLSDDSDDSHQIDLRITIVTFGSFTEQNSEHDLDPEEFGEVLQTDHRSVEVGHATVKMET